MKDSDKVIFHLCADIGSDTKPYKDAGQYEMYEDYTQHTQCSYLYIL